MSVPEASATNVLRMMADPISDKESHHVRVCDLSFEMLQIERGIFAIDAGLAGFLVDLETHDGFPLPSFTTIFLISTDPG
jgi:hypothetical protein